MLSEQHFINPELKDLDQRGRSYLLDGDTIATLEAYRGYYSIYWELNLGVPQFIENVADIIDDLHRNAYDVTLNGVAIAVPPEVVFQTTGPQPPETLRAIIRTFPMATFFRVDTPRLDAWAIMPGASITPESPGVQRLGGVMSRHNLAPVIAGLCLATNAMAGKLLSWNLKELREEFLERLHMALQPYEQEIVRGVPG